MRTIITINELLQLKFNDKSLYDLQKNYLNKNDVSGKSIYTSKTIVYIILYW